MEQESPDPERELPDPIHTIQDSRYVEQDNCQLDNISLCSSGNIAASGHRRFQSYVCIYSSSEDNFDSRDEPTLLYHKQFKQKDRSWKERYISFKKTNSTEIVTCRGHEVQVIDYKRDLVLRSRKVNGWPQCLSVSESQIFFGILNPAIVYTYDNDLNRIKSIRLKGIRKDWPCDILAVADRLYVCTIEGRAIEYGQNSGNILTEYTTEQRNSTAKSIAVDTKLQFVAVLWDKKQISFYSFSDNTCLIDFNVETGVSTIRISEGGRIVTGKQFSGEIKIYDLAHALSYSRLNEILASRLGKDDCKKLTDFFAMGGEALNTFLSSDRPAVALLSALEEKGVIQPSNVDRLEEAFLGLQMNSSFYHLVNFYQKLRGGSHSQPEKQLPSVYNQGQDCLHNQQQAASYNCQNITQLPAATNVANPLRQEHATLSYQKQHHDEQVLRQKGEHSTSYHALTSYHHQDVTPSREAFFRQAENITSTQEINSPSFPQQDQEEAHHQSVAGKKSPFVQCLKEKILHLSEARNFTTWGKFFRWKSADLFVSCLLTLVERKPNAIVKGSEDQLKLKYTEIFTHNELKSETRIAIQGGPGSGKTMLLSQLALDWSQGKMKDVAVLVYMPLKIVNNKTLIQAIKNFYIPENTAVSETDIKSILTGGAETTCLLLDGLEDYQSGGTMGTKQFSDVRRILKKEAFPNCKLVVTTHSYPMQDSFDGIILKIEEFGETERNSYIEKLSLGNIKREEKLKQLVEDDSFLLGLFNIPLFFALAVENIERMGLASDSLFNKVTPFVQNIIEIMFLSNMSGPETWSESELLTLGEIAYNGLCKELKQASWSRDFIETKTSRLRHWLDCLILAVEQNLTEQQWKEYQDIAEKKGRPNRENMEHATEQKGLQTYGHGGNKNTETSQSLGKMETEQHARYVKGTGIQSPNGTLRIRFLHEVIQDFFAATYLCSMMNDYTDADQFHEYVITQLQKINPEDLHNVLRFTSYLHPRSCSVFINHLLTNFVSKDGSIPSNIMDCIFLCFAEHSGTKGPDIKNSVTEVCKQVIAIDYEDGRFLQKAKFSLLEYASSCGITIEEVLLNNVISTVEDTFLTLNSGTKVEPLDTLQLIKVSQEDQGFHQDDFGNILKHFSGGNSIKTILCIFPCHPPKIVEDIIIENVKLKNIEVEWNNREVIWTLDPKKQIFLRVYDTMTRAGHFELKRTESHGHFPMSLPHTSVKSFDKWPTKRPLNNLTHSDMKLDVKAKRLKANWNLKVKNETEYKKEQDEEEILDLSKNKPSTSYHREIYLKEEGPSQDVSTMKIKEETCWSDSEQDIWTVKGEPSSSYGERKIVKTGSGLMNSALSLIKEEISESDSELDVWTVNPGETPDQSQLSSEVALDKMSLMAIPSTSKFHMGKGPVEEQLEKQILIPGPREDDADAQFSLETKKVITKIGGVLEIPNTGVVLQIPPYALPDDKDQCEIHVRIIPGELITDQTSTFSSNASAVVELLPNNLRFRRPVRLSLPHCLVLDETKEHIARVFLSHHKKGSKPQWEQQPHLSYHLEDTSCIILLDSFSWVKVSVDDEIVKAKKLIVYTAARKLQPEDKIAEIHVGYYLDLPGVEEQVVEDTPGLFYAHRKILHFVKTNDNFPLSFSVANISSSGWQLGPMEKKSKEITFAQIERYRNRSVIYNIEKKTSKASEPLCIFNVSQQKRQIAVQLAIHLKVQDKDYLRRRSLNPSVHSLTVTKDGGKLEIPETGVSLTIPKNALPADMDDCKIHMNLAPSRLLEAEVKSFCSNSTTAVDITPCTLQLTHPAKLCLPHCLTFDDSKVNKSSVNIYTNRESGSPSLWEIESDIEYELKEDTCIINLNKLCCVKYSIDHTIVEAKKIFVYTTAKPIKQDDELAEIEVGYYSHRPLGGELIRLNPLFGFDSKRLFLCMKEESSPLHVSLENVGPQQWTCWVPKDKQREIPFNVIASSIEHSNLYVLQKMDAEPSGIYCKFVASQKSDSIDLSVLLRPQQESARRNTLQSNERKTAQRKKKIELDAGNLTLRFLSRNLGREWRAVCGDLNVKDAEMDQQKENSSHNAQEVTYQCLLLWKRRKGPAATFGVLYDALLAQGRRDLADDVLKYAELFPQ